MTVIARWDSFRVGKVRRSSCHGGDSQVHGEWTPPTH